MFIFFIIAMLLSITGLDFLTAISGAASAISNAYPGLGEMIAVQMAIIKLYLISLNGYYQ